VRADRAASARRSHRQAHFSAALAGVLLVTSGWGLGHAADSAAVERGRIVFHQAGGCGCHSDLEHGGRPLAGGRPIKSPFGTFYGTNITPDPETGIGKWSEKDFVRAMTQGEAPNGSSYFPVFPYGSFTRMNDRDLSDLWAYLRAQPPARKANRRHEIRRPFGWRFLLPVWKWLYFEPGAFRPDPARSVQWNRGAYLVNGPGHCAECHTPRGWLGGARSDMALAGSESGPEGELAPNITPDPTTGIGEWRVQDVVWLLQTGLEPDGDSVQGLMAEAIEHGYKNLAEKDLESIAVYLGTVPPIRHEVKEHDRKPTNSQSSRSLD
jgi:mono/diheme cytochrome c family protein